MRPAMDELRSVWQKLRTYVDDLAHERQHYLDFFERSDAAYLVTDRLGVILEANGAAVDLLERRRYYLRGKPLAALVSIPERQQFRDRLSGLVDATRWHGAIETGSGSLRVEFSARAIPGRGICWRLQPAQ